MQHRKATRPTEIEQLELKISLLIAIDCLQDQLPMVRRSETVHRRMELGCLVLFALQLSD